MAKAKRQVHGKVRKYFNMNTLEYKSINISIGWHIYSSRTKENNPK
jgi:hypothetical protein